MKKQRIIELAVKVLVAALTAFLTAISTEKASRKARFFLIVTEAGSIFGSH